MVMVELVQFHSCLEQLASLSKRLLERIKPENKMLKQFAAFAETAQETTGFYPISPYHIGYDLIQLVHIIKF